MVRMALDPQEILKMAQAQQPGLSPPGKAPQAQAPGGLFGDIVGAMPAQDWLMIGSQMLNPQNNFGSAMSNSIMGLNVNRREREAQADRQEDREFRRWQRDEAQQGSKREGEQRERVQALRASIPEVLGGDPRYAAMTQAFMALPDEALPAAIASQVDPQTQMRMEMMGQQITLGQHQIEEAPLRRMGLELGLQGQAISNQAGMLGMDLTRAQIAAAQNAGQEYDNTTRYRTADGNLIAVQTSNRGAIRAVMPDGTIVGQGPQLQDILASSTPESTRHVQGQDLDWSDVQAVADAAQASTAINQMAGQVQGLISQSGNPQVIAAQTGQVLRSANSLVSQARGVLGFLTPQEAGAPSGVPSDMPVIGVGDFSSPEAYQEYVSGLQGLASSATSAAESWGQRYGLGGTAQEAAQMRSLIMGLAYEYARSQKPGRLNLQDVQNALSIIQDGDPNVLLRNVEAISQRAGTTAQQRMDLARAYQQGGGSGALNYLGDTMGANQFALTPQAPAAPGLEPGGAVDYRWNPQTGQLEPVRR